MGTSTVRGSWFYSKSCLQSGHDVIRDEDSEGGNEEYGDRRHGKRERDSLFDTDFFESEFRKRRRVGWSR